MSCLALTACQVTRTPDGYVRVVLGTNPLRTESGATSNLVFTGDSHYPIVDGRTFARPRDVADRLTPVFSQGRMPAVAAELEECYRQAIHDLRRQLARPSILRFCILYDAVASRVDDKGFKAGIRPRTPFLDPKVAAFRLGRFMQEAGMRNASEIVTFAVKGADLTEPYLPLMVYRG